LSHPSDNWNAPSTSSPSSSPNRAGLTTTRCGGSTRATIRGGETVPIDPNVDTVARTLWGEARGTGLLDMLGVAAVIRERYLRPGWWSKPSDDWWSVCRNPYQFSSWNQNDPNRKKLYRAEELEPDAFNRATRIAEYTI